MWSGTFPQQIAADTSGGWWAQWAFTSRTGGRSQGSFASFNLADHVGDDPAEVEANRRELGDRLSGQVGRELGKEATSLSFMIAAHGARVAVVDRQTGARVVGVDGLVTTTADVGVVALAADCVPMVLADVSAGVVGAAHCGWQGLVAGIVPAVFEEMRGRGATSSNTTAVLGPAICGACYAVRGARARAVAERSPEAVTVAKNGDQGIDVRIGATRQFEDLGITSTTVGGCTTCDEDLFSYRRDGVTGRQAGVIVLRAS